MCICGNPPQLIECMDDAAISLQINYKYLNRIAKHFGLENPDVSFFSSFLLFYFLIRNVTC